MHRRKFLNALKVTMGATAAATAGAAIVPATAQALTRAFSAFKDGPGDVPTNLGTIGSLSLPAGKYVIVAKLYVGQGSAIQGSVQWGNVAARLEAENDFDVSVITVPPALTNPFRSGAQALSLNVVHEFRAPGAAVVKLDKTPDATQHLQWAFLKITAIQVDSLSNTPMP